MKKLLLVLTLIAISGVIALGQDDYKKGEFFVGFSNNQVDTGLEERVFSNNDPIDRRQSLNGFNVSGVYNISRYVGIKGDVSGTYNSKHYDLPISAGFVTGRGSFDIDSSLYNVLGGVQIKDNSTGKKIKPFVHALVGAGFNKVEIKNVNLNTSCPPNTDCVFVFNDTGVDETGLAGAFGGGVDIKLSKRIDLRAIQVDYNPIRFNGETQNNFRFGIGLVFK